MGPTPVAQQLLLSMVVVLLHDYGAWLLVGVTVVHAVGFVVASAGSVRGRVGFFKRPSPGAATAADAAATAGHVTLQQSHPLTISVF